MNKKWMSNEGLVNDPPNNFLGEQKLFVFVSLAYFCSSNLLADHSLTSEDAS